VKNTILLFVLAWSATAVMGQAELKRAYKPAASTASTTTVTAPVTYSTSSPSPVPVPAESEADAAARRATALAKVQGKQGGTSAKGLRPSEYSTSGGVSPAMYSVEEVPEPSTTVTVNGLKVQRNVRKGRGQVGNELFTPVSELHYVQFAVYCRDTPVDKAPGIEGLYLLWHPGSTCPGGEKGASYIVKGYTTPDEAKAAVSAYKAAKVDCWYNPALTGAEVEIIGVR